MSSSTSSVFFEKYLETVLGNPSTRNLVIAVHPHKDHLLSDGSYEFGIGHVVAAAVEASKHKTKIKIFDGASILGNPLSDADVEALFKQEDCSCHLTDEAHSKFLGNLLSAILEVSSTRLTRLLLGAEVRRRCLTPIVPPSSARTV